MGAVALQVCPPIFNLPSQDDLLDYFGELSDAIDIGIMVYHTYWMPGGRIEIDTIMKMEEFEQVASIKWSCPDDVDNDEIARFTPIFNVIANGNIVRCHQLGARGYINLTAESYPPHDLKLWDLMENGKYEEAAELDKSVDGPLREFSAKVDTYSGGQGRVKKGIMALMGQPVGTSRPPSKPLKETDLEDLRNILLSFNWPVQATAKEAASQ
jgi:4-hydroxy-tetrahydrodipicolinate synthase